jgi:hypothetical protein
LLGFYIRTGFFFYKHYREGYISRSKLIMRIIIPLFLILFAVLLLQFKTYTIESYPVLLLAALAGLVFASMIIYFIEKYVK